MDKINYLSKYNLYYILWLVCLIFCCCSDYSVNLGAGYKYVYEGVDISYIFHEYPLKGGEVPSNVISYDYNRQFIIAKQKPGNFKYAYDKEYIYPLGQDTIYYWLIIKKEHKVLGPLKYEDFQQLREKYHVPAKLVLK